MKKYRSPIAAMLLSLLLAPPLFAQSRVPDGLMMSDQGFLDAHPDIKYRQMGFVAWQKGAHEEALKWFTRAARYADKPSQGMVGQMLWDGQGTPQNRAQAYAWMDLAAERKYRSMLIQRERYWAALSEEEREAAVAFGAGLYEQYGDAVAKQRLERTMRIARKKSLAGRPGIGGAAVSITVATPGGNFTIDGSSYFHPDYWDPDRYWAWQEKGWRDAPTGVVEIGPVGQPADIEAAKPAGE